MGLTEVKTLATKSQPKLFKAARIRPILREQQPQGGASSMSLHQVNHNSLKQASGDPEMTKEPECRPISQDQLINEVKGIYAKLAVVESKCREMDVAQSSYNEILSNEQWHALIALHRTLLHEHHDFFLASQHPAASPALKRLAAKHAMPARMWRHAIHSLLELLRQKLPGSLEHMLSFIYLSYAIMALLYEAAPAFEDTWMECLGDLARYRMAIEDDDSSDREVWTGVSRSWYSKISKKSPTIGRLYHHLAILARSNGLKQLCYYAKSLCTPTPFPNTRESIMTLFNPVLNGNATRLQDIDAAFILVHGILLSGKCQDQLEPSMNKFLGLLDHHIRCTRKKWSESGYFIGIALGCLLLEYGSDSNVLMRGISRNPGVVDDSNVPGERFEKALSFSIETYVTVIKRWDDISILPFIHTTLVFLAHMSRHPAAMAYIEKEFPWKLTAIIMNELSKSCEITSHIKNTEFPRPPKNQLPRPLPEDYAMRGLVYSEDYFPADWFSDDKIDEDEKYFELASMVDDRRERILWLGRKISRSGRWLVWDDNSRMFDADATYHIKVNKGFSFKS